MTAIINCNTSNYIGFGTIQQRRGKMKTVRNPRSELTMENSTESVTQNKQGAPKSTSSEDSAIITILVCYEVCINGTGKHTAKIPTSLWKILIRNPIYLMIFQKLHSQLCVCCETAGPSFTQNQLAHT